MATPIPRALKEKYTCTICYDDKDDAIHLKIDEDDVCLDCFKEQLLLRFEEAIKNESNWPVSWANKILDPLIDFPRILFSQVFLARWNKAMSEYSVPVDSRIYCGRCAKYIALRHQDKHQRISCQSCTANVCGHCSHVYTCSDEQTDAHDCPDAIPPEETMEGQVRGKDFQTCPLCDCKVALTAGCNAMPCARCKKYFCYICGAQADHDSSHWLVGNPCPRWLQPDSPRASFDQIKAHHIEDAQQRGRLQEIDRRRVADVLRRHRLRRQEKLAETSGGPDIEAERWTAALQIYAMMLTAFDHLLPVEFPAPARVPAERQNALQTVGHHMNRLACNVVIYTIRAAGRSLGWMPGEDVVRLSENHESMITSEAQVRTAMGQVADGEWKAEYWKIWDDYLVAADEIFARTAEEIRGEQALNLNRLDGVPDAD